MDLQAKYADKIAKLLRQAEAVAGTPEADAFMVKANALMIEYAVDEDMLARAAGKQVQEKIVEKKIEYTGIFQVALMDIGFAIARNNTCRAFFVKHDWARPHKHVLTVIGYESDVDRVIMLNASLQLQAARANSNWWKTEDRSWVSRPDAYKMRRTFYSAFAQGMASKLAQARKQGEAAAVRNEAARSDVTEEVAGKSVALVLRSREETVDDWYDKTHGRSVRPVTRRYASGGGDARAAGFSAGRDANTGTTGIGGSKGAISS